MGTRVKTYWGAPVTSEVVEVKNYQGVVPGDEDLRWFAADFVTEDNNVETGLFRGTDLIVEREPTLEDLLDELFGNLFK